MLTPNQTIKVKWCSRNKSYYESKGYKYTGIGMEFSVKAEELMNANQLVECLCDNCGEPFEWANRYHLNHIKTKKPELCAKCRDLVRAETWKDIIVRYCNNNGYKLVTDLNVCEISNSRSRFNYICPIHGLRSATAQYAKANRLCYDCTRAISFKQYRAKTFDKRVNNLYSKCISFAEESGYKLITTKEGFYSSQTYIEYECPKHGIKKMKAGNFANKRHCMECACEVANNRNKMDIKEVMQRIEKCHGQLLNPTDYINQSERNLSIICPECGKPFITSLVLFTQHGGQVCSECESDESTGERSIRYYLEERNILYEQEKWFSDCRDSRPLPFDFFLPDYRVAIEFDGYQHYYQNDHFTYTLEEVQRHDLIKNDYCRNNDIKLIRIPYWRIYKLPEILDKELNIPHKDIV